MSLPDLVADNEAIKHCNHRIHIIMLLLTIFITLFYLYLGIGLLFGLWFVFKGVDQVDEQMHGTTWRTRLLLLPGTAALWVVLLNKWLKTRKHGS